MPSSSDTSTILLLSAEILVVCLFVVSGLFWLLRRRNRQFHELEQTLAKQSRAQVEAFLARELQATQILAKTAQGDELVSTLVRLRAFWLAAEQQALIEQGVRTSDYKNIAATLKGSRIYAQLKAQDKPAASKPPAHKPLSASQLPLCDNRRLDEVRELIDPGKQPPLSPSVTEATREFAETAAINSNELLQTISRLEQELRDINIHYQRACAEIEVLSAAETPAPSTLVVSAPSPAAAATAQKSQLLLDEMRATFDYGSVELQRLRETNRRQRDLILEMESRLTAMQPGSAHEGELTQLIEKLQLQLRDYDNCTAILEMESESLRDRIDTFTQILAGGNKDAAPVLRAMSDEEAQLLLKRRQGLDRNTFQMLISIGNSSDITEAATAVINFLKTQNVRAVLFVNGHQTQLWLSPGAIDARVKALLQSVETPPSNPRVDDGDAMMILLPLCRFHLASDAFQSDEGEMLKELFLRGLVLVDLMLKLLDNRPAANANIGAPQIDQLASLLADIEAQQLRLDSETQRVIQHHRQEIEITLTSMATTASQKMVVEGLLGDFFAELDGMGRAAKVMHKSLQLAQQSIDELKPHSMNAQQLK